jgi:hypothetical protein
MNGGPDPEFLSKRIFSHCKAPTVCFSKCSVQVVLCRKSNMWFFLPIFGDDQTNFFINTVAASFREYPCLLILYTCTVSSVQCLMILNKSIDFTQGDCSSVEAQKAIFF